MRFTREMIARFFILLLVLALSSSAQEVAGAKQAQQSAPPAQREEPAAPAVPEERRVIDRPLREHGALRLVDALKFPFTLLGKGLDKGAARVEKDQLLNRVEDVQDRLRARGYEPLFGGLGTGTGFAFGVNISREHILGSNVRLDFPLQFSTHRYVGLAGYFTIPLLSGDRLFLKSGFDYQDRPQEDFFGLGPDSSEQDRANYELEKRTVSIALGSRLRRNLVLEFPVSFENGRVGPGTDNRFPDLQDLFPVSSIPGAESGAELFSFGGALEWDYRNSPALPTRGGIWRLEARYFRDTNDQDFRFLRFSAETSHYLPLDEEHGFALRALAVFHDRKGSAAVPFFQKAILGGRHTMRGFREFRFRDDHALLFNLEYRWQIWRFADAVLFVDEGQVAHRLEDFSLAGFRNSHGVGLRFRSRRAQALRVDFGHSSEGWRFYLSFSPVF
jgi:outer membrane protein assembly factor BamA